MGSFFRGGRVGVMGKARLSAWIYENVEAMGSTNSASALIRRASQSICVGTWQSRVPRKLPQSSQLLRVACLTTPTNAQAVAKMAGRQGCPTCQMWSGHFVRLEPQVRRIEQFSISVQCWCFREWSGVVWSGATGQDMVCVVVGS